VRKSAPLEAPMMESVEFTTSLVTVLALAVVMLTPAVGMLLPLLSPPPPPQAENSKAVLEINRIGRLDFNIFIMIIPLILHGS
jgi:hypothetical protein